MHTYMDTLENTVENMFETQDLQSKLCMCVRVHTCVCARVYICMSVCVHAYICLCAYVHVYVCVCTRMYLRPHRDTL